MGEVLSIQLCTGHRKPMKRVDSVEAVSDTGLRGDVHAIPESMRQVLLIEHETLEALQLAHGDVKENITTSGINLMQFRQGQRLKLGTDVVLEITKACTPCSRMDEIRPGLKEALNGRRGMLSRVVSGGTVRIGDPIAVM